MSYSLAPDGFDDSTGSFEAYDAEVMKAGVAHRDKGEQIVLLCKPANEKMRMQAVQLSMGTGDFKLGGNEETLTFGEGEKAWGVTIYSEIESGPALKTITNAGLFLNALKHLGFEVKTGDMREYIGLKLTLEEVAINEAIDRFNEAHPKLKNMPARTGDFADKTITIPVKLLSVKKSLKQRILEEADGKTEHEMIAWAKAEGIALDNNKRGRERQIVFSAKNSGEAMSDKEALIAEYAALEHSTGRIKGHMGSMRSLNKLIMQRNALTKEIAFRKKPFEEGIRDAETRQNAIKEELKTAWGNEDKTFKCAAGTATLRTTKSLVITDKSGLIQRLSEILPGNIDAACERIKSFDISNIRQYKDTGLISDDIAHYDLKQGVSIKVTEVD